MGARSIAGGKRGLPGGCPAAKARKAPVQSVEGVCLAHVVKRRFRGVSGVVKRWGWNTSYFNSDSVEGAYSTGPGARTCQ